MKILSWNIGGAHVLSESLKDEIVYDKEDVGYFAEKMKDSDCEIIGLQEAHTSSDKIERSHPEIFADYLKFNYFDSHAYGKSHIKAENYLSLCNISKHKITKTYFHKTPNPGLRIERPNGDIWVSFDVGFSISEIEYEDRKINFVNGHMVPFHYFKRDFTEMEFKPIRNDISQLFLELSEAPTLIVGDFNYNDLQKIIPAVFTNGRYKEPFVNIETTPGRGQQDHILYSAHWDLVGCDIVKLNSDHYQCIADLKLM